MRKVFFIILILSVTAFSFGQLKNGYAIDITIKGLQDSTVYMAYHLGDKQHIKDTIKLDKGGHGIVQGLETLPPGIYMIVLPGMKYFEFLISSGQRFSLSCNYSDYINSLKFTGSDENTSFVAYQKKWMVLQQQASSISKRIQNNRQNTDSLKILGSIQKRQEENMKSYLKNVIQENDGNLLATLVKALLPVDVPDFPVPIGFAKPDSIRWIKSYLFNKDHFFDNIDLTDEKLLRTPILYSRLNVFYICGNSGPGFYKQGNRQTHCKMQG